MIDNAGKPIQSNTVVEATVGNHKVQVDRQFYHTLTKEIKVMAKEVTPLKFKLKKGIGYITVISQPLRAKIYLDGKLQDYETPITLPNIIAGVHELRLVKGNYYWRGEVEVNTDEITVHSEPLRIDDEPPTRIIKSQAVVINDGSEITVSPKITLAFNVVDETDVTGVKVAEDEELFDNIPWQSYVPEMEWVFRPVKPGIKTVYVRFMGKEGYESDTYSATIKLLRPMDMVLIEKDTKFVMKIVTEGGAETSEAVSVQAYFIDKYEVTNAQYKEFVDATGYKVPDGWIGRNYPSGKGKYPVVNVSVEDARRYAKWSGKRLPTEAEWVMTAIGTDKLKWPWGDWWDGRRANIIDEDGAGVKEIGSHPDGARIHGKERVYDIAGNVWEWVEEYQDESMAKFSFDLLDKTEKSSCLRGGLLRINGSVSDASLRLRRDNNRGYPDVGFRCAVNLSDWKDKK